MTPEKASTLRLLQEGIGNPINVIESQKHGSTHTIRAQLLDIPERNQIPILFLITSLAFLEAAPPDDPADQIEYKEFDGWTPVDLLDSIRFIEGGGVKIALEKVRGRNVFTEVTLKLSGEILVTTRGRGHSANRWIHFVKGKSYLTPVNEREVLPA